MAFRDLASIREMFRELSEPSLEQAHFDAYQRKLAYKREWYRFNRGRVLAYQHAYYQANKPRINAYDKRRKNTEAARAKRRKKKGTAR